LTGNSWSKPALMRQMIRFSESNEDRKLRDARGSVAFRFVTRLGELLDSSPGNSVVAYL